MSNRGNGREGFLITFCVITTMVVGVLLVSSTLAADAQYKASESKKEADTKTEPKQLKTHGALLHGGERIPISQELREFLTKRNYKTLTLINPKGQVKIVDLYGVDVEPCGQVEGTQITGNCKLNGIDLINHNTISIFGVIESGKDPNLCRVNDLFKPC
jgi:hypothetical protein